MDQKAWDNFLNAGRAAREAEVRAERHPESGYSQVIDACKKAAAAARSAEKTPTRR